jgi:hypothetical protein
MRRWLVIVFVAALLPYVRLPAWPLYPDAERAVLANPAVAGGSVADVLRSDFWGKRRGDVTQTGSYRPVVSLTYWAERRLFGPRPAVFHLFDMLLHAAGAALLLLVLQRIVPGGPFAIGAALLFAVHPALSEAVCSVVGRADLLAGTAFLAALLLHRRATAGGGARWDAAALVCVGLALFSKEYAAVFPLLLFLFDWLAPAKGMPGERRRQVRFALLALALVAGYIAVRALVLGCRRTRRSLLAPSSRDS